MSDFDRKLVNLADDVTGGQVLHLSDLVDDCGSNLVSRVIADGFGAVVHLQNWTDDFHERIREALRAQRFIPTQEALRVISQKPIPLDYFTHQAPGALGLEDEPNLIFRYAADDPEAIAEVRSRHGLA
jgi:hypothetical protein